MEVYNIRLPETAIEDINTFAKDDYIPPRTLVRKWILQRLEIERSSRVPGFESHISEFDMAGGNRS